MDTSNLGGRNVGLESACDPLEKKDTEAVLGVLRELVDRLTRREQGELVELESWEGGGHLYVETPLAHWDHAEIDISIHDGRAFVTMAI